jgi:hypothetical protein
MNSHKEFKKDLQATIVIRDPAVAPAAPKHEIVAALGYTPLVLA